MEILQTQTELDNWLEEKLSEKKGSSSAGHHYIQAYNQNKWGFYLRYVRGLEPIHTKPALLFGGNIHDAKEAFYVSGGNIDFTLKTFEAVHRSRLKEYESSQVAAKDIEDGKKMLFHWASSTGHDDFNKYDIVEVEGSHEFELANKMKASVRWDLLVRSKDTHKYYLFDTKTTRFSITASYNSVENQDQVTMYLLALKKVYPDYYKECVGLIPDIMYKKQSVVSSERPGIVMRTPREILEYEQEIIGLHIELAQKIQALRDGFPTELAHMLFPRNGKDDSYFGSEWPNLYRQDLPKDPYKAPLGYKVNTEVVERGPAIPSMDKITYPLDIQEKGGQQ